ncbi:MAG: hypothetical protein IH914_10385 [candidate division Zixibacteria bacterium]|nr:hypothetical protein [candidate division Zixibacteria bacterium]
MIEEKKLSWAEAIQLEEALGAVASEDLITPLPASILAGIEGLIPDIPPAIREEFLNA